MKSSVPHILLSTAYLPPVQYISKFLFGIPVYIEKHENYQKQSWRNRCCIYGANGPQILVIPVKKTHGDKMPLASVEIDFTSDWKRIHLKSIESAYRLSAFYEYYADDLIKAFQAEIPLLFDWNMHLIRVVLKLCQIRAETFITAKWETETRVTRLTPGDVEVYDYRNSINPKNRLQRPDPYFSAHPYQQVFADRYGFLPNLSIMDLIFNTGPQTLSLLKTFISWPPSAA